MQIRVYYEDTDAGGVVYHSNYLNFCERDRSDIFFKNGLSPHKENAFFVVKRVEADFIKSAKLGDLLDVETKLTTVKKASLILTQTIYKDGVVLFKAIVQVVYLINGKIGKIPLDILELFDD